MWISRYNHPIYPKTAKYREIRCLGKDFRMTTLFQLFWPRLYLSILVCLVLLMQQSHDVQKILKSGWLYTVHCILHNLFQSLALILRLSYWWRQGLWKIRCPGPAKVGKIGSRYHTKSDIILSLCFLSYLQQLWWCNIHNFPLGVCFFL
jgi:hypothetical protein